MSALTDRSVKRRTEIKSLDSGNVKLTADLDRSIFNRVLRMKA